MTEDALQWDLDIETAHRLRVILKRSADAGTHRLVIDLERLMRKWQLAQPQLGLHVRRLENGLVSVSGDVRILLGYSSHNFGLEADVAAAADAIRLPVKLDCNHATFYALLKNRLDADRLLDLIASLAPAPSAR